MKIKCTLKQLYDYNETHNHILDGNIKVNGRFGFNKVNTVAITARNSKQIKIETDLGDIVCSPDHLLFNGDWVKVKNLTVDDMLETKFGAKKIKSIQILPNVSDLYDLDVSNVHEFYANDIVSHNSSISNLITFMLYGQVEGFTLPQIPNRINKNMEGWITVKSGDNNVKIHRGLNPSIFEVFVNEKKVDTAGKANVQNFLEEEIYGVPYSLFKNSIVLSVDSFKSFIKLTPKEKREIIDRLFGYSVLNDINQKVKDKIKELNRLSGELESKIDGYNESITTINEKIELIKSGEKSEDVVANEKLEKENELKKAEEDYIKIENAGKAIIEKKEKGIAIENEKREEYVNANSELEIIKRQRLLYNNKKCPTCGADLCDEKHTKIKEELEEQYNNALNRYNRAKMDNDHIRNVLLELDKKLDAARRKANETKLAVADLKRNIQALDENKQKQIDDMLSLVDGITKKIEPAEKELAKTDKNLKLLDVVLGVFSETGLKQYISNMYIPIINKCVEELREKLNIGYKILFDINYNCKLFYLGEEVSYKTLSNGERKKSDIAVTLAFLKIMKTKINDINLLFLDEVLSGIDVGSCNELLDIFKDFSKELNMNMFIVHHANLENSTVDRVLEVKKQNSFSHFVE